MVKHIVFWRLKDFAESASKEQNARRVKALFEQMRGKIPGMLRLEVGINFESSSAASDIVLYTEFESREALNSYQVHPEHMKVKDFLPLVRIERRVVDYEI
jgi:Stress responsive A/B Barrel Domain